MAALTKNAISVKGRDKAKRTQILDHKGYKCQKNKYFQKFKILKLQWECVVFVHLFFYLAGGLLTE